MTKACWLVATVLFPVLARSAGGGGDSAFHPVPPPVRAVLDTYCIDCHGEKKSKGRVRLDMLPAPGGKEALDLLDRMQEQIHFAGMPPEDEKQPGPEERKQLADWVRGELVKSNGTLIEDKLRYPDYGNNVDHGRLFSGEIQDKPFSPARRWLVSPQIFMGRIIDVFRRPEETYEKYMHWPGSTSFHGITNPFVLPDRSGIRDYSLETLDGGHLLVMLGNAEWMSHKQIRSARVKKGDFVADFFPNKADRFSPPTPPAFEAIILDPAKPGDDAVAAAIQEQFRRVLQRPAAPPELEAYLALTRSAMEIAGNTEGLRQMLVAVLLESEFLYRHEFGAGEPDAHGRRMLSPREASHAIAHALGDWNPDPGLVRAVAEGRLNSREDVRREVLRLLDHPEIFKGQIDRTVTDSHIVSHPKVIRFFREFFGYPGALKVFKDKNRSDGYYDNPGRGDTRTPGKLVREADMVVSYHVARDRNVFENLLGATVFFAAPLDPVPGIGAKPGKPGKESSAPEKMDALLAIHDQLKDTDWKTDAGRIAAEKPEAVALIRKHLKWNGGQEGDIRQIMTHVGHFRERGLDPSPWWAYPFGMHELTPHVHSYNLNPPEWAYPRAQPFTLPNRRGILTHPAWLIAHSSNFHTDPIRRGRWIREKLLAGRVPDVPITVDAKVPEDPHRTFRERVEAVTGPAQESCWKCHRHMNPLGYAFEMYDDFGRFQTEEPLENPENLIAKAKGKYGADTYKTKPVVSTGELRGTGDSALDGEVRDALEMIDRLVRSQRVRQSIIRHAFRFYMGRNEMLSDSRTLIDADRAYVESGGSFKAVIVSLLTSDSFLYRK